jgi:S-adenosylmethionine:tRNA ribosyltransferase-isomerase
MSNQPRIQGSIKERGLLPPSRTQDFDYVLPSELIAKHPLPQRDASKMLVLRRETGVCEIRKFNDIFEYLRKGDCAVFNNTKVINARIFAAPKENLSAETEFLLLEALDDKKRRWTALAKPAKRLFKHNLFIPIAKDSKKAKPDVIIKTERKNSSIIVEFIADEKISADEILNIFGHVPLPPYIKRPDELSDKERYQTVYGHQKGAVAAPTAGLHFTKETLANFAKRGVKIAEATLHAGAGTFQPVKAEFLSQHKMRSEFFQITEKAAIEINNARKNGGRIIAVGTTSLRALESALNPDGSIRADSGKTDIFIYPPYKIKSADILLTNFHLPKSTLIMLASAFAGKEKILAAYQLAIREKFRFYSYGDCMLIL